MASISAYQVTVGLIERLHRSYLEVVKLMLDRLRYEDINNVQALILYNIGHGEVTVGELTARGYYLGSNVSYNVKKMVESGYLRQERSLHDKRSQKLRLSDKGIALQQHMEQHFEQQKTLLAATGITLDDLGSLNAQLFKLEHFWTGPALQRVALTVSDGGVQ